MKIYEELDKYPKAIKLFFKFCADSLVDSSDNSLYNFFDLNNIRCFVKYGEATGKFKPEIWKAKTISEGENDWKMERVGFISCEFTRKQAETVVFKKAFELLEEKLS